MKIEIGPHARERMMKYNVSEKIIMISIKNPDLITKSYGNRSIYNKKLNGYTLRIIIEEDKEIKRVITTYKARSGRYGI